MLQEPFFNHLLVLLLLQIAFCFFDSLLDNFSKGSNELRIEVEKGGSGKEY